MNLKGKYFLNLYRKGTTKKVQSEKWLPGQTDVKNKRVAASDCTPSNDDADRRIPRTWWSPCHVYHWPPGSWQAPKSKVKMKCNWERYLTLTCSCAGHTRHPIPVRYHPPIHKYTSKQNKKYNIKQCYRKVKFLKNKSV